MNEQFGAAQKLGYPMNERFGAVQKLSACPLKRVRAPCLSRGVTPQLILAFRCNPP